MTEKIVKGYCVKCKATSEMNHVKKIESNNRARLAGQCVKCQTKMSVFIKKV